MALLPPLKSSGFPCLSKFMKIIEREEYLNKLKSFKDKHLIKVITGIRRCGKSTLLEIFQKYLLENDVSKEQIIAINFENPDYRVLRTG